MTEHKATPKDFRTFGLIVGGVFAFIGMWPMAVRGEDPRWWALSIAGLLITPALIIPRILRPFHQGWMFIGHVLGWINTRIILAIGFYGILMPVGLVMRLMGKDSMRRRYAPETATYRVARTARPGAHMRHQF